MKEVLEVLAAFLLGFGVAVLTAWETGYFPPKPKECSTFIHATVGQAPGAWGERGMVIVRAGETKLCAEGGFWLEDTGGFEGGPPPPFVAVPFPVPVPVPVGPYEGQ
jgi:hypothetical protein